MKQLLFTVVLIFVSTFIFAQSNLHNTSWQVTKILKNGKLSAVKGATINFDGQGKVNGSGGCNRYGGNFSVKKGGLKISSVFSTKMACDNLNAETAFFSNLEKVNSYILKGEILTLINGKAQLVQCKKMPNVTAETINVPERKNVVVQESKPSEVVASDIEVDEITLQRLKYRQDNGETLNDTELMLLNSRPNFRDIFTSIKEEFRKGFVNKTSNGKNVDGDFERAKELNYQLIEINGSAIGLNGTYSINIPRNNSRILFQMNCNQSLYEYTISGNDISFRNILSSNVICTSGDDYFNEITDLIQQSNHWEIVNDKLVLSSKGSPTLTFQYQ